MIAQEDPVQGKKKVSLDGAMATGAVPLWTPLVERALNRVVPSLPEGSRVLEIGYGNGMLACYVTQHFGWKVTGYDILEPAWYQARYNAALHGLLQEIDFHVCKPEETLQIAGSYDAILIKTVIYNCKTIEEYEDWLDWVLAVLKPGGVLVNWESGRGHWSVTLYRKLRGRYYTNLCMYDTRIEDLYRDRFTDLDFDYAAGLSWTVSWSKRIYPVLSGVEDLLVSRDADNSFAVAITGRKPQGSDPDGD